MGTWMLAWSRCLYVHVVIVHLLIASQLATEDDLYRTPLLAFDYIDSTPCSYEGNLVTENNWYGYLANVTISSRVSRLTFEFAFPAELCCPSVLFYSAQQASLVSSRMSCWQREYLLSPEHDQILRLTPTFSWSGCQLVRRRPGTGQRHSWYVCHGGRSLVAGASGSQQATFDVHGDDTSSSWYIAVSNCESLHGLELRYRVVVYGQSAECVDDGSNLHQRHSADFNSPVFDLYSSDRKLSRPCTLTGSINITDFRNAGTVANLSLAADAGFSYRFSFDPVLWTSAPVAAAVVVDEDQLSFESAFACRRFVRQHDGRSLTTDTEVVRVLEAGEYGCSAGSSDEVAVCSGFRWYAAARRLHVAVISCLDDREDRDRSAFIVDYRLDVFGADDKDAVCSGQPSTSSVVYTATIFAVFVFFLDVTYYCERCMFV